MSVVRLVATARQIVSVGAKGASAVTRGLPYIPGSTLRGALAARWLRVNNQAERRDEFIEVFERSRFGPLLPVGAQLIPRSYKEHKYGPGAECLTVTGTDTPDYQDGRCRTCGEELVPLKEALKGPDDLMVNRTRVELTDCETAKEEQLFERSGLRPTTVLVGHAYLTTQAREWLGDGLTVRVGASVTVAGEVRVDVSDEGVESAPTLARNERSVILLLGSPAIFVDEAGRPTDRPSVGEISRLVGTECQRIDDVWARWSRVGGWHAASGLPKPGEWAVDMGSTYTARFVAEPSREGLERLVRRGVGLRRSEGFGWLAAPVVRRFTPDLRRLLDQPRRKPVLDRLIDLLEQDHRTAGAGGHPVALRTAFPETKRESLPTEISMLADLQHPADLDDAAAALRKVREGQVLS